ncbi:MAG: peptidylprolyl isomerase [Acidobacteriaceae bacterium]|nr:peptidylprolyl isomerase [Acidobacteriaceae bacterium]
MIRTLQKDNGIIKAIWWFIIGAAIVTMVITLVPGIFDNSEANDTTVFATVRSPGFLSRLTGDSTPIRNADIDREVQQQMRRQNLPSFYAQFLASRVGQQQVERAVLVREANHLGLQVSDDDLARELRKGVFAQYLFPNGQFIGQQKYMDFVQTYFNISVADFETEVKQDLEIQRLQALVTGGITVSDAAVRTAYLKQGTKIQFDYASLSADDIKKTINPSDSDLQAFFKQNATRYATAVPEQRKLQLISFSTADAPNSKQAPTEGEIQGYYNAHKDQYKVQEQVQTRHILISSPKTADSKTDAAAKAKAEDVLKQLKAGGNFAELAKKYSEDPGSKDKGGELPMIPTSSLDPAYAKAAMALNPGQTSDLVRSQFGYHIIQTIAKDTAHDKPLSEVHDQIAEQLTNQKAAAAAQTYAAQLSAEAKSKGLAETATAHNLHLVSTDYIGQDGVIGTLADSTSVLKAAFGATKGAAPQVASTGEGYAVFQVLDVKAAHAPDFADWKLHILDDYKDQKTPELLNQQLIKLSDRAKALGDLKKAAAEMHLDVKSSDLVGRDGQVQGVGSMGGAAAVAFDLTKGAISGPINNGSDGAVLQLTDKQQPTDADIAKNFQATKDKVLSEKQQEAFGIFAGTAMQRYEKAGAIIYSKKQAPSSPFGN